MSPAKSALRAPRRHAAAAATIAAGVVHLAATGPHLSQGWMLAAGFLTVGILQVVLGIGLAVRGDWRPLSLGTVGINVIAMSAWALSRTVGLPAFLHPGVEPIGMADAIAATMGLVAIMLLVWRASRPTSVARSRTASLTVLTVAWVLALTGTAAALGDIADTAPHGHDEGSHESADHHGESEGHRDQSAGHHDDEVSHDSGATRPRPQQDRASEVVRSDTEPGTVEVPAAASPSPESPEDHTHAPGEEH